MAKRLMRIKPTLTYDQVCNMFDIDPETGIITYKRKPRVGNKYKYIGIGAEVGYCDKLGYRRQRIKGHTYLSHHIAWLLYYGVYPGGQIDHINGVKAGNGIWNLRLASTIQNNGNRSLNVNSTTGHKGVTKRTIGNRIIFRARLTCAGEKIYLGDFKNANDAAMAYNVAAIDWFSEYAKLNNVEI